LECTTVNDLRYGLCREASWQDVASMDGKTVRQRPISVADNDDEEEEAFQHRRSKRKMHITRAMPFYQKFRG
jgi:hypothetical protein